MKDFLLIVISIIGLILGAIGLYLIFALLLAFPVMLLWNWLMPIIFGLIKINFWQSFGLLLLAGFLTKGSSSTAKKED